MPPVSAARVANTRKSAAKMQSDVLQRLALVTQERVAERMGKSGSTVSRFVSEERLAFACELLAACGLKVVQRDAITTTQDELLMLKRMAIRYLEADVATAEDAATEKDAA